MQIYLREVKYISTTESAPLGMVRMDELVTMLESLVNINTVNDPANNIRPDNTCADVIAEYLSKHQIETEFIDHQGFRSVLGKTGTGRPVILFMAHYDVVPARAEAWSSNPFILTVKGNRAYGRGVVDDKGSVVAILLAAKELALELKGQFLFLFTGDEEIGGAAGVGYVAKLLKERNSSPDYVINADGPGMEIIIRRRNSFRVEVSVPQNLTKIQGKLEQLEFTTDFFGRPTRHAAYFVPGVDRHALLLASKYTKEQKLFVKNLTGTFMKSNVVPDRVTVDYVRPSDEGKSIEIDENLTRLVQTLLNITRINFKTDPSDFGINITPNVMSFDEKGTTLEIDVRAMLQDKTPLEKALTYVLAAQFRNYSLTIRASPAPVNTPIDSTLVAVARKVALSLGLSDKPLEKEGAADSRFFSMNNIPTVDFTALGGGHHGPNEWVDLSSILTTAKFFSNTARELCYIE